MGTGRHPGVDAARLLQGQPVFAGVGPGVVDRLAAAAERRSLARGEALFHAGDRPTGMYLVVFGSVRLVSPGRHSRRLTGVVGPGQSLSEPVMFLDRPALVDAVAAEDCLVLHVPREAVLAEIRRDPEFALRMLATLSQRVEGLVHELGHQATGSARKRLADYLARHASDGTHPVVTLPATKAAVAAQLLMTPEHFSRLMRDLSRDGLVKVEGRQVLIADLERLRAAAPRVSRASASSPGDRTSGRSGRALPRF